MPEKEAEAFVYNVFWALTDDPDSWTNEYLDMQEWDEGVMVTGTTEAEVIKYFEDKQPKPPEPEYPTRWF